MVYRATFSEPDLIRSILKWVVGIASTVVASWLIWYLTSPPSPKMPAHPGTNTYQDPYDRFSLKYPIFLGGLQPFSNPDEYGVSIGIRDTSGDLDVMEFILSGGKRSRMTLSVWDLKNPVSHDSLLSGARRFMNQRSQIESTRDVRERIITNTHVGGSYFLVTERSSRFPFVESVYTFTLLRIAQNRIGIAMCMVSESEWKQYRKELEESFYSIRLGKATMPNPR